MSEKDLQILRRIKTLLMDLTSKPGWEESIILSVSRKKLLSLLERCDAMLAETQDRVEEEGGLAEVLLGEGQQAVYISLFQAQGQRLDSWEPLLLALPSCLGRPVYADEEAVRAFVESRPIPEREGYVKLAVDAQAILPVPVDKQSRDPSGRPLLTLRPQSVHVHQIMEFVHANDRRYRLQKGKLIPMARP